MAPYVLKAQTLRMRDVAVASCAPNTVHFEPISSALWPADLFYKYATISASASGTNGMYSASSDCPIMTAVRCLLTLQSVAEDCTSSADDAVSVDCAASPIQDLLPQRDGVVRTSVRRTCHVRAADICCEVPEIELLAERAEASVYQRMAGANGAVIVVPLHIVLSCAEELSGGGGGGGGAAVRAGEFMRLVSASVCAAVSCNKSFPVSIIITSFTNKPGATKWAEIPTDRIAESSVLGSAAAAVLAFVEFVQSCSQSEYDLIINLFEITASSSSSIDELRSVSRNCVCCALTRISSNFDSSLPVLQRLDVPSWVMHRLRLAMLRPQSSVDASSNPMDASVFLRAAVQVINTELHACLYRLESAMKTLFTDDCDHSSLPGVEFVSQWSGRDAAEGVLSGLVVSDWDRIIQEAGLKRSIDAAYRELSVEEDYTGRSHVHLSDLIRSYSSYWSRVGREDAIEGSESLSELPVCLHIDARDSVDRVSVDSSTNSYNTLLRLHGAISELIVDDNICISVNSFETHLLASGWPKLAVDIESELKLHAKPTLVLVLWLLLLLEERLKSIVNTGEFETVVHVPLFVENDNPVSIPWYLIFRPTTITASKSDSHSTSSEENRSALSSSRKRTWRSYSEQRGETRVVDCETDEDLDGSARFRNRPDSEDNNVSSLSGHFGESVQSHLLDASDIASAYDIFYSDEKSFKAESEVAGLQLSLSAELASAKEFELKMQRFLQFKT